MGASVFIAYLSALCNIKYTATQYALLSSFAAFGVKWLSLPSGALVENTDYVTFFFISVVIALPGMVMLYFLQKKHRHCY